MSSPVTGTGDGTENTTCKALAFMKLLFPCRYDLESKRHIHWVAKPKWRHREGSPAEVQ